VIEADASGEAVATERAVSGRYLQKRQQILDAACRKFNTLGVRGATLEDIASDVGMNLTSIRHYFRRKDDLVAAGFLRSIEVHETIFAQVMDAGGREARVRELVRLYFGLRRSIRMGEGPEVMIFGDMRSLEERHAGEVWPRYAKLFQFVRRMVSSDAELTADRQRANARAYFVLSQLLRSVYWLPAYPADTFDWVEQRFVDLLLHGLAAEGAAPKAMAAVEAPEMAASAWEAFLLAATRLINQQGYRGASVEAIARQLNRTKGSFYHHVEGKGDLLVACFNRSLGLLAEAQRTAMAAHARGLDRAYAATQALVRRQQTTAGPLLRSSALMSAEPDRRDAMLAELAQVVTRFSAMATDGMIDGSCRPCDARIAGEMMMVTVNAAGQLGNWAKDVTPDAAVDYFARPMFLGLFA